MTNKEILEKAFNKAYYNDNKEHKYKHPVYDLFGSYNKEGIDNWIDTRLILSEIFSHEFTKAFWGEKVIFGLFYLPFSQEVIPKIAWKYHLSKMVLEKEPLKYLERFLN